MHVRYTSLALHQLADILNYIADENSKGAGNVSKAIERAISHAAFMPKLGRPVPRQLGAMYVLARPYPYRIIYRVHVQEPEVLAIVHTSRQANT